MGVQDNYSWEIETDTGNIYNSGNNFDGKVIRISFISKNLLLPRHDIIFTTFTFKKRFGRGFVKQSIGLKEYLHCVITDKFRFYLKSSNGSTLIVDKNYELYI